MPLTVSGKIRLLRVNEVGDRFGPPNDNIQAEVIVQFEGQPEQAASGFQLRVDGNQAARQGMLDLLRDGFNHGHRVGIDHEVEPGKTKGRIIRVWLTKDPAQGQDQRPGGAAVFNPAILSSGFQLRREFNPG